jgi:LacI family transcriptional regulator
LVDERTPFSPSPRHSPPTIYDVVELAGVSIATVSRVLNNPDRVSEPTRRKVMAAIDQLNFVPKADARASRLKSSGRIGVITPFFTSPSFNDRLRGVASALANSRYELIIYTVDTLDRLNGYLSTLPLTGHLDGLIIISLPVDDAAAQRLITARIDTVLIENAHPDFSAIVVDDHAGGRLAAEHLVAQGHRRCAFVYFDDLPEYSIHPEIHRLAGYREALAEHDIPLPDEYIRSVPVSRMGIREALRALFDLPAPPTAIFAPSDDLAIRVIHRARELGLHTPRDISVIGYDDIDIAEHVDLTTIAQMLSDSGKTAGELLLAGLNDRYRPMQHIELPVRLRVRGTTRSLTHEEIGMETGREARISSSTG